MCWRIYIYIYISSNLGSLVAHAIQELQHRIEMVMDEWGLNGRHPSDSNYREEMAKIRKDIVDFHGEMVLLENYSSINYTGLPAT